MAGLQFENAGKQSEQSKTPEEARKRENTDSQIQSSPSLFQVADMCLALWVLVRRLRVQGMVHEE